MLCDVVCTGGLQNQINTIGPRTAKTARRRSAEDVKFPKNAIAASALIHAAETVAFMYVGCMIAVYRHPSAVAVLN
jgi:hypothetical protein